MISMNGVGKQPFTLHASLGDTKYGPLASTSEAIRRACLTAPLQGNIFAGLEESLLVRAEALAAVDIVSPIKNHPFKPDASYASMNGAPCMAGSAGVPLTHASVLGSHHHPHHPHHHHHHQHHHHPHMTHQAMDGDVLEHLPSGSDAATASSHVTPDAGHMHAAAMILGPPHVPGLLEIDTDPRELEAFAERFKQRRIKLGVTQADVGAALGNLKIPGVGSLSQSTICRFESLTLSHNNMIALKPILQAWLDEAEKAARSRQLKPELFNGGAGGDRRRKRTAIAGPERRSLEAYFAVQPRPSSEKIAAIAEKLDLKKNVVRVWFCNQRQKQKRMKFAASH
uniref:POU domain protein n=1 Tax=Eptatretus burgeri TaxID=7764 RepID=A0A8C4WZ54_EPTBU